MNNKLKAALASLVLVAALLIGLCIRTNVLAVIILKLVLTLEMIVVVLMYYGCVKVSLSRQTRVQRLCPFFYLLVLGFLLLR